MTGADSPVIAEFVDRGDAFDDLAVARDDVARLDQHHVVQPEIEGVDRLDPAVEAVGIGIAPRRRVGASLAERIRLRLAAPFRDGLGEIGEKNGEPEPGRDLAGEEGLPVVGEEVAHEQERHDGRHRLGHEDDGVSGERPRIELAAGVDRRGGDDPRIEQALRLGFVG